MKYPKFSFIVIAYNSEDTIRNCIESILNQEYCNYEIIFINDGSTDRTLFTVRSFAERFSNIKIINQTNKGRGISRNVGLKNAQGDFICYVDSDDTITSLYLKTSINYLKIYNFDILIFDLNYNDNESRFTKRNYLVESKEYIYEKVSLFQRSQSVISTIIRKDLFTKNKIYFPKFKSFEDLFVLHRIVDKSKRPILANLNVYNYSPTINSVTNNICITDLHAIKSSIHDFYFHNKNTQNISNILQERIANTYKFVITKLILSNSHHRDLLIKIFRDLSDFTSTFNLCADAFLYLVYLCEKKGFIHSELITPLFRFDSKKLEYIKLSINNRVALSHHVQYLNKEQQSKNVYLYGVGNSLFDYIKSCELYKIEIEAILSDEIFNYNSITYKLLPLNRVSTISNSIIIVTNYNSSSYMMDKINNETSAKNNIILCFHDTITP